MYNKILRWMIFGVVVSIAPFAVMASCYWIDHYEIQEFEYILNLLPAAFAIAANVLGLVLDDEKQINKEVKLTCGVLAGMSMFLCISMYVSFSKYCSQINKIQEQLIMDVPSSESITSDENDFDMLNNFKQMIEEDRPDKDQLNILKIGTVGLLILNMIIGFVVEIIDSLNKRKQREPQISEKSENSDTHK